MPRVFDNLTPDANLLSALQQTRSVLDRADFCIRYFNLRGWGGVGPSIDNWKRATAPAVSSTLKPTPTPGAGSSFFATPCATDCPCP